MNSMIKSSYGAVAVLLLLVACSPLSDKREFEREQAKIEAHILELHDDILLEDALRYGLFAPVVAEIERQGSANFFVENSDNTALYEACLFGADQMVEMLLSRGADPSLRSVGELPIHIAWNSCYDFCTNSLGYKVDEYVTSAEIGRYSKILEMLSVPDVEFEPRSNKAEGGIALEVVPYFLYDPTDWMWKDGIHLKINGADCPAPIAEEFRKRGYRVYSEPRAESQEIRLGVEWITDDLAKVELFIPVLRSYTARVTYAYGHWLVEYTGGYDF